MLHPGITVTWLEMLPSFFPREGFKNREPKPKLKQQNWLISPQ